MDTESVITQFEPALARLVATYERDRALQGDLLQEVLMAILTSLHHLDNPDKLKPFIFRIAHNRCISHVARRMRDRNIQLPLEDSMFEGPSHEETLIRSQRGNRLLEAVRCLELPYRQVMTLLLEDMSYEDIAESLGITVTNVGVRVNRAKQQLKGMLHDER